ncbi:MFS transporter [Bosea sp. Root381]|uniref:MFS transporter n=1 Tax=Bosea sp. Root381 TaxID=1736524 RepID=UPI0006F703DE|nr:MFS transporter [Bosea sp. Root381]KRE17715.1 MFS transporter [Bosea sp. Root381]
MTIATDAGTCGAHAEAAAERPGAHVGLVLFALAMGGFAIGTAEFAVMSLVPYFSVGLGIDEPTAGHVISAYALGVVVGAPIIAVLAARVARHTLLIGLMAVFAVANLLSALAPSYGWMLVFRFFSGLPHGAYFGVAALVAASLSPPNRRAQAVARVMLGLTVATIIGVPFANWMGQALGWRWGFGIVALLALVTVLLVFAYAPRDKVQPGASPLRELGALGRRQVWLTLGIGAIGFGGMFAVYTYVASTLMEVTLVSPAVVPVILCVFGLGLTAGTLVGAWLADRALMPAIGGMLLWTACALAIFPFATGNIWAVGAVIFLIGTSGGLGPMLQTRLMDVAEEAQTLAAALNHSAFNAANALGPWLGGMAIAAGYGWSSTGWVGSALALGGFAIWVVAVLDDRLARAGSR